MSDLEHEPREADRVWLERVRSELDPGPMSPNQRAAFRRSLDERIAPRHRVPWMPVLAAAATLALVSGFFLRAADEPAPNAVAGITSSSPASGTTLLAYAYYETDYLGDDSSDTAGGFLPADYEAIATAFEIQ